MKLLIDLTNNGTQYVELRGERKKVLAAMAGLIVSSPELGSLIREAINESDRAEKERPDLCARMREDFKNNASVKSSMLYRDQALFFFAHTALRNTYIAMAMRIFLALSEQKITSTYPKQHTRLDTGHIDENFKID